MLGKGWLLIELLTLLIIIHHSTLLLRCALSIIWTRRPGIEDRVIGMGLDMFLEILWALEGLATELALVRLEWNMNSNVGGDMITFDGGGVALAPLAGQVEVVSRLASDMALADMFLLIVSRQ